MQPKLRWGVLGAGQISRLACQEINRHLSAQVVAASDPSPERFAELSASLGGVRTFADNEALLAAPEVDAVFIATPNAFHAPLAKRALEQGKHVLVEKPFATNAVEAAEVVEQAEQTGKLLSVGMNQRFRPDSQRVRAARADGQAWPRLSRQSVLVSARRHPQARHLVRPEVAGWRRRALRHRRALARPGAVRDGPLRARQRERPDVHAPSARAASAKAAGDCPSARTTSSTSTTAPPRSCASTTAPRSRSTSAGPFIKKSPIA